MTNLFNEPYVMARELLEHFVFPKDKAEVAALLAIAKELADIKVILSDMQRDMRDIGHIVSEVSNPPDPVGNSGSLNVRIRTGVEV